MRIDDLEYHSPVSLAEACRKLSELGLDAKVIAGGTDLLADLKQELLTARHLISLGKVPDLKQIESKDGGLWIGALATPNMLAASDLVRETFPALSEAAASMAGTQIRNLGTIGGNLCSAVPSADLPPSLLVADAELRLTSHEGERSLPIREFFIGPRKTALRPGELLTGVFIPDFLPDTGTAYEKFQLRDASALAVVGAAAMLTIKEGRIAAAAVAVGAAAPTPILIESARAHLEGKAPIEAEFLRAGELAAEGVRPISDIRGSAEYRRDLARVLTVRALKRCFERVAS